MHSLLVLDRVLVEFHMARLLLANLDSKHADCIRRDLADQGHEVDVCSRPEQAIARLRRKDADFEAVIFDVSNDRADWMSTLVQVQAACMQSEIYPPPCMICISRISRPPEFELRIEYMGARYVFEE
jgi:CheY-like chemotaxis protein